MKFKLALIFFMFTNLATSYVYSSVVCLDFETAQDRGCQQVLEEDALAMCHKLYGGDYLAFEEDQSCHHELADSKRGFVSNEDLISGIKPKLAEISSLMEVLDRRELAKEFPKYISKSPVWGNESIDLMIEIYQGLESLKQTLKERSQLEIKNLENSADQFLTLSLEYYQLVIRYYKLEYALRFHLSSDPQQINAPKLAKLHLQLRKPFAYRILKKIHLKAKHIETDMVEFMVSEQEKVLIEYSSLSHAKNSEQYAYLLAFLGLRENLNNLWAIDRMVPHDILNTVNVCGDFHTLRSSTGIDNIPSIYENTIYEVYHKNLAKVLPEILNNSMEHQFVNGAIKKTLLSIAKSHPELLRLFYAEASEVSLTLEDYLTEVERILIKLEMTSYINELKENADHIVLSGDPILSPHGLSSHLAKSLSEIKADQFRRNILIVFPWLQNRTKNKVLESLSFYIRKRQKHLNTVLLGQITNFLKKNEGEIYRKNHVENFMAKYDETKKVFQSVMPFMKQVQSTPPESVEQLMVFFNKKLLVDYKSLGLTISKNSEVNNVLNDFITSIKNKTSQKQNVTKFEFWQFVYEQLDAIAQENDINIEAFKTDREQEITPFMLRDMGQDLDQYLVDNPELIVMLRPELQRRFKIQQDFLLGITRDEFTENVKIENEKQDDLESVQLLGKEKAIYELLKVLKYPQLVDAMKRGSVTGVLDIKELQLFKRAMVEQAYYLAPILKQRIISSEMKTKTAGTKNGRSYSHRVKRKVDTNRSFLEQARKKAIGPDGKLDEQKFMTLFEGVIARAENIMKSNIEKFCQLDLGNYTNDKSFREIFINLEHIRRNLPYNDNISYRRAQMMQSFDQELAKSLRTKQEVLNDEFIGPSLKFLGVVSIVGLSFVGVGWVLGASAPAWILTLSVGSQVMMGSIGFSTAFFTTGSIHTYHRLNQEFIEVPAQLKFQRDMLKTQIKSDQLFDEEYIKEVEKENNRSKIITTGLLPLDLYFGGSLLRQIKHKIESKP